MCVQLRKISLAHTSAYYQSRLVPPGAHFSFMALPLVPIVKIRHMSTLQCVSNCCKVSPASPLAYCYSRLVPHGARSSFIKLLLVLIFKNHYMSTL